MGSQPRNESSSSGYLSINSTDKPCNRTYTRATSPEANSSLTARHEQEGTNRVGKDRFGRRRSTAYDARPSGKIRSGRNSPVREALPRPGTPLPIKMVAVTEPEDAFDQWISRLQISAPTTEIKPPISAFTLAELECKQITSNPRLRHDVNFDRELHFRPNLDGSRGQEKLQVAQQYWNVLESELEAYGFLLSDENGIVFRWTPRWTEEFKSRSKRIPQVFNTIKEILLSLLPEVDRPRVGDMMDTQFIMQQIERGMFDMTSFFCTLAELLKVHCAPMRDNWLDRMVALVTKDAAAFSPKKIVSALKELFGILEAMKLDIANHHIRYLRPSLLESTIGFEQAYYIQKMSRGHVNIKTALTWLNHTTDRSSQRRGTWETFLAAFVSSMFPFSSAHKPFPPTFKLDHSRLYALCTDVCNVICTDVCIVGLEGLMGNFSRSQKEIETAVAALPALLQTIVGARANEAQWASQAGNIAAELVRIAAKDNVLPSPVKPYTKSALIDNMEYWVRENTASTAMLFIEKSELLQKTILARVKLTVCAHIRLTPSAIFESLVAAPARAAATTVDTKYYAASAPAEQDVARQSTGNIRVDDLIRRASHIAVLHYRVWAPLLYEKQPDAPPSSIPTPPTSPKA